MTRTEVFDKVIKIIAPFAPKNLQGGLTESTHITDNLGVNSARFVDIVLELEDQFGISIDDSKMGKMKTVGDVVNEVMSLIPVEAAPGD
jgi:acyl carrier protein